MNKYAITRISAAAAIIMAAASCNIQPKNILSGTAPEPRPAIKVETLTVGMDQGVTGSRYVGETVPDKEAVVTASYPGRLVTLNVKKGDRVQKGSVLAEISSQSVRSSLEIAEATLRQAEDGYERVRQVFDKGGVSQVQMVDIETKLAKAKASAEAARQALEDCRLTAPFSGVVSEVLAERGEEVGPAQPLVYIIDVSALRVRIAVHENEINRLARGALASVEIPALGLSDIPARVSDKSMVPSALSHSYDCTLEFLSRPKGLMPGMAAKATFSVDGTTAITVPASAVQMDREGKYVWLSDEGTVRKARITAGGYQGRSVVVESGLEPGDKVITAGYQKVSTGMKVTE